MFSQALDQFAQATKFAATDQGSKPLTPSERAALSYSRGYANVMRYEAQTVAKRDVKLLEAALAAFDEVPPRDANFHKAQRAKIKIRERTQASDRSARWGTWIVVFGGVLTLLVANIAFLLGKPGLTRTFQVQDASVQSLKTAKAPDDVIARVEALGRREPLPRPSFESELKSALGEEWAKRMGDTVRAQASTQLAPGWHEAIEAGYYALLSFGAMIFIVAGLYLQQLSKLKFGGIELEKTSEATTKVIGSLGITR
jgi:hypothetical protein